jgi:chaperonin cofactor prefoldin
MVEKDADKLADELEQEADELEERSKNLKEQTDDVAQDWERKRSDESVPGAPPPTDDED